MQLLGEFYDLKSNFLESEENIIKDIEGRTIEEKTTNVINWFMHNDVSDKPKTSTPFDSKMVDTVEGNKHQKEAKKGSYEDKERQKAISITSTQDEDYMQKSLRCRIRMLVGYGENDK